MRRLFKREFEILGFLTEGISFSFAKIVLIAIVLITCVFPYSSFGVEEKGFTIVNTVTDYTAVLTPRERKELRILSDEVAEETGIRILYLVVERISVFDLKQFGGLDNYASELCREWKFRKKNKSPVLILFVAEKNQLIIETSFASGAEISTEMRETLFNSVFTPRYSAGDSFEAFFRLGEALYGMIVDDPVILKLIETDKDNSVESDIDSEFSGRALRGIIGFFLFIISLVTSGLFVLEGRRSLFEKKSIGIVKRLTTGAPGFIISFILGVTCYGFLFGITLTEPRWWGLILLGVLFSLFEIGIITLLVKVLFSGMTNELAGNREAQVPLYAGLRCKKRDASDSGIGNFSGGW